MHAEIVAAEEIAKNAAIFDWSWTVDDLARCGREFGWREIERSESGATYATGLDISRPEAVVFISDNIIREIIVWVSDIAESLDDTVSSVIADGFEEIQSRLMVEFGPPSRNTFDEEPSSGWDLPNVVIFVSAGLNELNLSIVNPDIQKLRDVPEHSRRVWKF